MNTLRTLFAALLITSLTAGGAIVGYHYEEGTPRDFVTIETHDGLTPQTAALQAGEAIDGVPGDRIV